ncbi:MAG: DUF805 domain-containing protein [Hyphomicrobiaceae bacterium]|nr:DUF805 domain-containing protein [Hyphomicrobiaceae bacterium]
MATWEASVFGGCSSRKGMWAGLIGYVAMLYAVMFAVDLLPVASVCTNRIAHYAVLASILILGYPFARVAGRRLHDLGWTGWPALALPMLVSLRYDFTYDNAKYYCDVGVLTSVTGAVKPMVPGSLTDFFAWWPSSLELTINSSTIEMAAVTAPLIIYLGFFKGQTGPNTHGHDQRPAADMAAA